MALVGHDTFGRGEADGAPVADVAFRRSEAGPVGGGLDTFGRDAHEALFDVGTGLPQEHLEDHLGLLVVAFAEVVVPDATLGIDEVQGGPVVVVERLPDGVVVVHHDRVADVHLLDGAAHVVEVALELELGRLHADDRQPAAGVRVRPGPHVGQRADPVDARVGAEADEDDLSAEARRRQGPGVEPGGGPVEPGQHPFDREFVAVPKHAWLLQRSDLNAARSSDENSSGCSQAAKWPPRSSRL